MIHQIVELNDFPKYKERYVNSYTPFYILDNVEAFGTEAIFYNQGTIKHYLIIEQLEGTLYLHDVIKLQDIYYPISTKVKNRHYTIRKNYTLQIESLLKHVNKINLNLPLKTHVNTRSPNLPIVSLMEFLKWECLNDEEPNSSIPEDIFLIYEHGFNECSLYGKSEYPYDDGFYDPYNCNDYETDTITYNWRTGGYIDSINLSNLYLDTIKLLHQIRYRIGPKPGRSNKHTVEYVTNLLSLIAKHSLPNENNLCIWKDLDQIIEKIGIYYPDKDFQINEMRLNTIPINYETFYVKDKDSSKLTLLNLNIKDFLLYCDLFLPINCEIIFEGNTCKKFIYTDEYFYTYLANNTISSKNNLEYNLNLINIPSIFYVMLSNLLMILNHKTGLERYQYKVIKKLNDNKVKLHLSDKYGREEMFYWDLTLLHITDPIQYGFY